MGGLVSILKTSMQTAATGAGLLLLATLAGCSGIKPYPNDLPKNVDVYTKTAKGTFFTKRSASVDIYLVHAGCKYDYRGTLYVEGNRLRVGVPNDQIVDAEIQFSNASRFGGDSSSLSVDAVFKPKRHYHYRIDGSYLNDFYNVTIMEFAPGHRRGHRIHSLVLPKCGS